jgi:hypothetical protein
MASAGDNLCPHCRQVDFERLFLRGGILKEERLDYLAEIVTRLHCSFCCLVILALERSWKRLFLRYSSSSQSEDVNRTICYLVGQCGLHIKSHYDHSSCTGEVWLRDDQNNTFKPPFAPEIRLLEGDVHRLGFQRKISRDVPDVKNYGR